MFPQKNKDKSTEILRQLCISSFVMRCAIWYHLYNLKNVKNTHGGVLLLVKLQAKGSWLDFIDNNLRFVNPTGRYLFKFRNKSDVILNIGLECIQHQ